MARRRVPVAGQRSYPSGLLRCLVTLAAALQFVVACSGLGTDTPALVPPTDGQMAGSDSGADAAASYAGTEDVTAGATSSNAAGASNAAEASNAGAAGEAAAGSGGAAGALTDPFSDAGASGAADGFVPAPHAPFPLVTAHGGPVIQKIELVPVYFGADPLFAELESFNTWLVGSTYWKTVGADYGVLAGTRLPAVQFASVPASPISVVQIRSWLDAQIAGGFLAKPTAHTVFVFYYPAGTTITIDGSPSCSAFAGLHDSALVANAAFTGEVPFVVIPRCSFSAGDELMIATDVASHEIIEAATDPFGRTNPAWQMDNASGPLEAWLMLTGWEIADLCLNQSYDVIEGVTVQDIWSNSAAQAGKNPCQPSDPKHPFFSVSAEQTIYHAQPGATLTIHARAWSNLPTPDWSLGINWGLVPYSDFDGQAVLSKTTVNNGDELTAVVTIPSNPPVSNGQSEYRFTIDSIDPINPNFAHPWPILIVVP
ncbi:MAG: hypothetical protein WDO69_21980 [Pseudomonadota bacterium]